MMHIMPGSGIPEFIDGHDFVLGFYLAVELLCLFMTGSYKQNVGLCPLHVLMV